MKKTVTILSTILATIVIMFMTSVSIFAEETELNPDELKSFITRKEFTDWQESFIASLSELDKISTEKIYDDMDFYDMQYRFTPKYKTSEYMTEGDDPKPTAKLQELILKGKAKRNRL